MELDRGGVGDLTDQLGTGGTAASADGVAADSAPIRRAASGSPIEIVSSAFAVAAWAFWHSHEARHDLAAEHILVNSVSVQQRAPS
jgi:hypothetical protein